MTECNEQYMTEDNIHQMRVNCCKKTRKRCESWTLFEDGLLTQAVQKNGERNWPCIANVVGTKNSDQCRKFLLCSCK